MRSASAVLGDLLVLIERTEFGARAAPDGLQRWAISCARRAVSHNVEGLGPELPVLRAALARAARFIGEPPDDDAYRDATAPVVEALRTTTERYHALASRRGTGRRAAVALHAQRAVEAVEACLACAARGGGHEQVGALARRAFVQREVEAEHQARRLLVCTKLVPSGAELLIRLDQLETLGRLPTEPDARAWIEAQRIALMAEDEASRITVLLRHLELVFLPELERIR